MKELPQATNNRFCMNLQLFGEEPWKNTLDELLKAAKLMEAEGTGVPANAEVTETEIDTRRKGKSVTEEKGKTEVVFYTKKENVFLRSGLIFLLLSVMFLGLVVVLREYSADSGLATLSSTRVVSLTKTVSRGGTARITIQGKPDTNYSITVQYSSGYSTAAGLYPKRSDADGYVSWSWRVGTNTTRGEWPIIIREGSNTYKISFNVR